LTALVVALAATACTSSSKSPGETAAPSVSPTPVATASSPAPLAEGAPRIISATGGAADNAVVVTITFDGAIECGEAAASHVLLELPGSTPAADFGSCGGESMTVVFRSLTSLDAENIKVHYKPADTPTAGNAVYRQTSKGQEFAEEQSVTLG
jgi:hypothetical protein